MKQKAKTKETTKQRAFQFDTVSLQSYFVITISKLSLCIGENRICFQNASVQLKQQIIGANVNNPVLQ